MQYKINISAGAKIDIIEAQKWYDNKEFGFGAKLIQRIDEAILQITYQPFGYRKIFLSFRKKTTKQFSYSIYYYVNIDRKIIDIIAVLHARRSPALWKQRVKKFIN